MAQAILSGQSWQYLLMAGQLGWFPSGDSSVASTAQSRQPRSRCTRCGVLEIRGVLPSLVGKRLQDPFGAEAEGVGAWHGSDVPEALLCLQLVGYSLVVVALELLKLDRFLAHPCEHFGGGLPAFECNGVLQLEESVPAVMGGALKVGSSPAAVGLEAAGLEAEALAWFLGHGVLVCRRFGLGAGECR